MTGRKSSNGDDVRATVQCLREGYRGIFGGNRSEAQGRVLRAFATLASLWEARLQADWTPPSDSSFPWAQVRLSLSALLLGLARAGEWLSRSGGAESSGSRGAVTALVLAGNTPLLAWSPVAAALLAGHAVFVKQSRDETVWTRLFVETLAEVDGELASLIHLDLWPGDDPRTTALIQSVDAIVAYGSDTSIEILRGLTTIRTPFLCFGHAVSVGVVAANGLDDVGKFARDILLYSQGGCLSAQAILVEEQGNVTVPEVARRLAQSLQRECATLEIPPVTDPAMARTVRQARDMALFLGEDVSVIGDPALRWTIIVRSSPAPLELPVGSCVVQVTPLQPSAAPGEALGAMRGYISCVGVSGELCEAQRQAIAVEGASRICGAGEMQMPPLDWSNGNRNLLAELLKVQLSPENENRQPRDT